MRGRRTVAVLFLSTVVAAATIAAAGYGPTRVTTAGDELPWPARPPSDATDAAIGQAQAKLRANPDDGKALKGLAGAYLQKVRDTGDPAYYPKVEALLAAVLRQAPDDAEALTLMGVLSLGRHQFRAALDWGQRARAANPYSARALGVIGDAQIELGRYPEALATIQQMVDLRPDLGSYARVSHLRELHGDVPGAIAAMRLAIEAGGPVPENVAYTRVLLGTLFFNSGRPGEAEAQYREALASYPNYVHALAGMARVRAAGGDYAEATALYRRAIDIYPAPEYVIALGDVYTVAGDGEKAREAYDLALVQQRLSGESGVNVDAELALFAADQGRDLPAAVAAARRAWEDRPSVVTADVLAWTLYRAGADEEALAASASARRLGTRNALFFFHSGMIKARLGLTGEARADLTTALAINPHFSPLQAAEARRTLAALDGGR